MVTYQDQEERGELRVLTRADGEAELISEEYDQLNPKFVLVALDRDSVAALVAQLQSWLDRTREPAA